MSGRGKREAENPVKLLISPSIASIWGFCELVHSFLFPEYFPHQLLLSAPTTPFTGSHLHVVSMLMHMSGTWTLGPGVTDHVLLLFMSPGLSRGSCN